KILSYESGGLPNEYLGSLLVAAWADHRVERYVPKPRGSSFAAERKPFLEGGRDFRPVGIALAPDGSLFVSDWVLRDYNLHGRGAVWHVKRKDAKTPRRPDLPREALFSIHRPAREAAARTLAADNEGRAFLRQQLASKDVRVRAASLAGLLDSEDNKTDVRPLAE